MEIRPPSNDDVDHVVPLDDLSLKTVIALIDRLSQTETSDQFLCRELELDAACLQTELDIRAARDDERKEGAVTELQEIRGLVLRAHDFVGENNLRAAIQELNRVIEIKVGL
jgi:hypothetical protein